METRDLSDKEQFAISIRWVTHDWLINEDLIALAEVEQTDGATLKNVLLCNGLEISNAMIRHMMELQVCLAISME